MRTSTPRAAVACAFALALLTPAIALAAQEADQTASDAAATTLKPGNVAPEAALESSVAGGTASFDASGSSDADGRVVAYEWDLDGDSVYETKTGSEARVTHDYPAGTTLIAAVRVTDDAGATDDATGAVTVAAAAKEPNEAAAPAPAVGASASDQALVAPDELAAEPESKPARKKRDKADEDEEADEPTVTAAASKSVTISDFEFAPTTVTVNVGDTVTWTNRGPTAHTATADNGTFDSGNMARGRTYSRKFSASGTFSYFCKPHPFMKGKVVVAGKGGSGSGGGSGGGGSDGGDSGDTAGATASGADAGSSDGGSLANTGVELLPWALFGFSVFAFGAALRLRLTVD